MSMTALSVTGTGKVMTHLITFKSHVVRALCVMHPQTICKVTVYKGRPCLLFKTERGIYYLRCRRNNMKREAYGEPRRFISVDSALGEAFRMGASRIEVDSAVRSLINRNY